MPTVKSINSATVAPLIQTETSHIAKLSKELATVVDKTTQNQISDIFKKYLDDNSKGDRKVAFGGPETTNTNSIKTDRASIESALSHAPSPLKQKVLNLFDTVVLNKQLQLNEATIKDGVSAYSVEPQFHGYFSTSNTAALLFNFESRGQAFAQDANAKKVFEQFSDKALVNYFKNQILLNNSEAARGLFKKGISSSDVERLAKEMVKGIRGKDKETTRVKTPTATSKLKPDAKPLFENRERLNGFIAGVKKGINQEGILRITGDLGRVNPCIKAIEQGSFDLPLIEDFGNHDFANIFKKICNASESQPGIFVNFMDDKNFSLNEKDTKAQDKYKEYTGDFPKSGTKERDVLELLVSIARNSEKNKMTASNIAVTTGLFADGIQKPSTDFLEESTKSLVRNKKIQLFIEAAMKEFPVETTALRIPTTTFPTKSNVREYLKLGADDDMAIVLSHAEQNSPIYQAVSARAKQELNSENLEFLRLVAQYKKTEDEKEREALAKRIIEEFVPNGSKSQLNLKDQIRKPLEGQLTSYPKDLFDPAAREIWGMHSTDVLKRY